MHKKLLNFEPGIELKNHIARIQKEPTEENRRRFLKALETAELFVVRSAADGGLALLHTRENEALLPAFTLRQELNKWPFSKGEKIALPFVFLRQAILGSAALQGLLIDPFGTPVLLRREELIKMVSSVKGSADKHAQVRRAAKFRSDET